MPEITELLEQAAPGGAGPAPLDDIVRRGRRRKAATRAAAVGAPLAVVAVVVGVFLTGGSPTGVVIDPPPPMAETPDPTPSVTEPAEPAPEEGGEPTASPDTSGWMQPSGLAADVLVVQADGGTPTVTRLRADGSQGRFDLEDGVPNEAGLVPDGEGGFGWQPDWQSASPPPVLHMRPNGDVGVLGDYDAPSSRLVGLGEGGALITRREGEGFEDTTGDLLLAPFDEGSPEVLRTGVEAWETGLSHAAMLDGTVIYAQYVEAMHNLVIDPPDGDPVIVFEGGELNGEYPRGVGFSGSTGQALALVERGTAFGDEPYARLLVIDPIAGEVVDEIEVPLGLGLAEGATVELLPRTPDVSVHGDHVLVNRRTDEAWLPPVVYDLGDGDWSLLEHRDDVSVTGRAFLAPPLSTGAPQTEFADCYTEDQELRNAAPGGEDLWDSLFVYLPCTDWDEPQDVHRLTAGVPMTLDLEDDLTAVLEVLLGEAPTEEQSDRGYLSPVDGLGAELRSVAVDGQRAVVDVAFPNGANNLNTAHNSLVWHRMLFGTVFQFEDVTSLELRLDGSCEDYASLFQSDGCLTFGVAQAAPWNTPGR